MFAELKKLLKHSIVYGVSNILQKGIGFFMIPVYTHFLSPADYGILELMDLTINVISIITGMGLGAALVRFYHQYQNDRDRQEMFSTAFVFVFFFSLLVVIFLEFFARPIAGQVLGTPDYFRYFQIVFVSLGLQTVAAIPENQLIAQAKSIQYSTISLITLISYLSFNILFLVVYKWGLIGLLISTLITKILNNGMLLVTVRKSFVFSFSIEKLKEMVLFSFPLIPASFAMFIIHFSDRFFIQRYCSLDDLGIYSLGYKFGMIISVLVSQPFFKIWNTQRFEIVNQIDPGPTLARFLTYYAAIALFIGLCISVFIKEAIQILAPSEYTGASHFVALIVLSYIFYGIAMFFSLGAMVTYKTKYQAYIQIFSAIVNILLNIILIKQFGVIGAAYSTALTFLVLWVITMANSQWLYHIPIEYKRLFILFFGTSLLFAGSLFVDASLMISLGIKGALILIYPVLLILSGFFKPEELTKLKQLSACFFAKLSSFKLNLGR